MLTTQFQVAGGSIIGRDHLGFDGLLRGKNNQDAYFLNVSDRAIVAVVCDGCSEGAKSEAGAIIGSQMLATIIVQFLSAFPDTWNDNRRADFWMRVQRCLLARLNSMAAEMAGPGSLSGVINDNFLFTTVALVITPSETQVAACGDGVFAVNGEVVRLGPFPNNAPPYLAYCLGQGGAIGNTPDSILSVKRVIRTQDLQSAMIGSDGVLDWKDREDHLYPGQSQPLGPLSQFWENERCFSNPDEIRRRLTRANTEVKRFDAQQSRLLTFGAKLKDDTTMVVVRRAGL